MLILSTHTQAEACSQKHHVRKNLQHRAAVQTTGIMNRFYYLLGGFALGLAVLAILASTTSDGSRKIEESGTSNGALRKLGEDPSLVRNYAVKIPEGLNFAGEKYHCQTKRYLREWIVNCWSTVTGIPTPCRT